MTSIAYFKDIILSGKIKDIQSIKKDKKNRQQFSFILSLKPDPDKVKEIFLTTWETNLRSYSWFKIGAFVYCHAEYTSTKFWKVHNCSIDAYDCYRHLIERINKLDIENNG